MILRYQKNAFLIFCLTILFLFVFASATQATSKDNTNNKANNLVTCEGYQVWAVEENQVISPLFQNILSLKEWNNDFNFDGEIQLYGLIKGELFALTPVITDATELTQWIDTIVEKSEASKEDLQFIQASLYVLAAAILLIAGLIACQ